MGANILGSFQASSVCADTGRGGSGFSSSGIFSPRSLCLEAKHPDSLSPDNPFFHLRSALPIRAIFNTVVVELLRATAFIRVLPSLCRWFTFRRIELARVTVESTFLRMEPVPRLAMELFRVRVLRMVKSSWASGSQCQQLVAKPSSLARSWPPCKHEVSSWG